MSSIYEWEEKPEGISWIDKLNAAQATDQCKLWGLTPASTLEQNRIALKNAIRGNKEGETTRESGNTTPTGDDSNKWLALVQATAENIGSSIAQALAASNKSDTSQQYNLPYVVKELAARAPVCSGTEPAKLLKFLQIVKQILRLELLENRQVLIAILHKTSGQLRELWMQALHDNQDVAQLLHELVNVFLPDRAKQQLLTESVYRVQGRNETLSEFIIYVREAAEILLPADSDILDIILTGINSPTRARLAGFQAPTRLSDLLALIPRMEVIRQLEVSQHNRPQPHGIERPSQPYRNMTPWQNQQYRPPHFYHNNRPNTRHDPQPQYRPRVPFRPQGEYSRNNDHPRIWRQSVGNRPTNTNNGVIRSVLNSNRGRL